MSKPTKAEITKAALSTLEFTKLYFKNPNDSTKKWKPHAGQITLYDVIDYGYDIRKKNIRPPENIEVVLMSWPRQNGKTEGTASACAALLIRYAGAQIGVMSNSHENAKKLITRIYRFLEHGDFKNQIQSKTVDSITLTNGSRVDSFGQTPNIRGNSYWWLIIDEAAMFKAEMIEADAIPTTREAGAFRKMGTPSVILLSTPAGITGRFAELYMAGVRERWLGCRECGKLHDKEEFRDLSINWFKPENLLEVPLLPECDCGYEDYEYVDKYYTVVSIDPYSLRSKEELDKELMLRGNTPAARQELLGEFLGSGANVFRHEWLETCTDIKLTNAYKPDPTKNYFMGIDFGKSHDATVFCVCHKENDLTIFDWIGIMPGKGLEYADIRKEMLEHIVEWNPILVIPDTTGMGNAVCEQLERDLATIKKDGITVEYGIVPQIKHKTFAPFPKLKTKIYNNKPGHHGFLFDMNSKPEIIDHLATLFMHGGIKIPPEQIYIVQTLWDELVNFGYVVSDTGRIKYGVQSTHDDTVIALALACWGINQKPFITGKPILGGKNLYVYENGSLSTEWGEQSYSLGFR